MNDDNPTMALCLFFYGLKVVHLAIAYAMQEITLALINAWKVVPKYEL